LLTETDHPFADRAEGHARRPGRVDTVEEALRDLHSLSATELRLQLWRNLATLVIDTSVGGLLPAAMRRNLALV
jgi:TatD DNase family protein